MAEAASLTQQALLTNVQKARCTRLLAVCTMRTRDERHRIVDFTRSARHLKFCRIRCLFSIYMFLHCLQSRKLGACNSDTFGDSALVFLLFASDFMLFAMTKSART